MRVSAAVAATVAAGALAAALAAGADAAPAAAWGRDGHEIVTSVAIDALPPDLRSVYDRHRGFVVFHSVDPDRWRDEDVEMEGLCRPRRDRPVLEGPESPRHFLDAELVDPHYPFRRIPADFDAYRQIAGDEVATWGSGPWAVGAYTELLSGAMTRASDLREVLCLSAILAHYVEDLSQPFHLTENYNGQLSGLEGIHFRFESDLVAYHADSLERRIRIAAPGVTILGDPVEAALEMLVEGYPYVDDLLRADLRAQAVAPLRDGEHGEDNPAYMRALWRRAGDLAAERMGYGAAMTASYWMTAWDAAGRPDLSSLASGDPRR